MKPPDVSAIRRQLYGPDEPKTSGTADPTAQVKQSAQHPQSSGEPAQMKQVSVEGKEAFAEGKQPESAVATQDIEDVEMEGVIKTLPLHQEDKQ